MKAHAADLGDDDDVVFGDGVIRLDATHREVVRRDHRLLTYGLAERPLLAKELSHLGLRLHTVEFLLDSYSSPASFKLPPRTSSRSAPPQGEHTGEEAAVEVVDPARAASAAGGAAPITASQLQAALKQQQHELLSQMSAQLAAVLAENKFTDQPELVTRSWYEHGRSTRRHHEHHSTHGLHSGASPPEVEAQASAEQEALSKLLQGQAEMANLGSSAASATAAAPSAAAPSPALVASIQNLGHSMQVEAPPDDDVYSVEIAPQQDEAKSPRPSRAVTDVLAKAKDAAAQAQLRRQGSSRRRRRSSQEDGTHAS